MKNKLLSLITKHRQLITYGIIGLSGALLDFIFYLFFYYMLGITPSVATFLSVSIGILNNFIINSRYNFKVEDNLIRRFLNFYLIGIGGAIVSVAIIIILFHGLDIDAALAKAITIPPVVLVQYFLNKKFSFHNKHADIIVLIYQYIKRHILLFITIVLFVTSCLIMTQSLSLSGLKSGPDESIHYKYNIKQVYYRIE